LKKNLERLAEKNESKTLKDQHIENLKKGLVSRAAHPHQRLGEGNVELDQEKLKKAVDIEKDNKTLLKKRKLFSQDSMTEEELEAYRLTRHRADDPMANYVDMEDQNK
jgi:pre-mRNA-processing factor SLU7